MKYLRLSRGSETKGRHWISITKIIRANNDDDRMMRIGNDRMMMISQQTTRTLHTNGWEVLLLVEKRSLSLGLLGLADDGAIPPANVGVGGQAAAAGCRPESAFWLGAGCDGQVALDVEADGSGAGGATVGVFSHDQLAEFGFQGFVERVLVGFVLAAVDVLGRLQLRRMHPRPVDRSHRLGLLALAGGLLVVAFGQQRLDQVGDLLGDEAKLLGQFRVEGLRHHF
ncbi:hypothetical protein DAPPUDRAFT_115946 [Daphnia pulex]|uniref:Uncharacterized protein n=1 Tax=Daphnia pulex TaxID=6669 RepID=E9HN21_DAPPU|nr:hypothetical protein DAPPUDRAFT_115946 [Daphnia pulex]|eukprot:EFX66849.1 hypothetical protein DAPPUDRAFT_115946 [Daphnia pulex]